MSFWGKRRHIGGGGVKSTSNPLVLQLGSVVIAPIEPDGGINKPRPAIIIGEPSSNPSENIWVIGITTDDVKFDPKNETDYPPKLFKAIPHAPDGSHPTRLTSPCAAKANWVQDFPRSKLVPHGILSGSLLNELLEWIDAGDESEIAALEKERKRRHLSR